VTPPPTPPPLPLLTAQEDEYVIDAIIKTRTKRGKLEYLVSWKGYDDQTWEAAETMQNAEALDAWESGAAARAASAN
jgi:hypothetical protein